jgi:predicted SprT family Zn-dependent metalloprotease
VTLPLPSVLFRWVGGALLGLAALILHHGWDEHRRRRRRPVFLYVCESCGLVYEDDRNVPLSACRRCGMLNAALRR